MSGCAIVKDFIDSLDPEDLPIDYLHAAKFHDRDGREIVLKGEELKRFMNREAEFENADTEVEIFIDVGKFMKAVTLEVEYIYHCMEQKFYAEDAAKGDSGNA